MTKRKLLNKSYGKLLCAATILTTFSLLSVFSTLFLFNKVVNNTETVALQNQQFNNKNNLVEKNARTTLPTDFTGNIKSDGTTIFPDTQEITFVGDINSTNNPNSWCTTPLGVFMVLTNGAVLLNPNTNEVFWKLTNSNGQESNIGILKETRIFDVEYNPDVSAPGSSGGTIIIASMTNQSPSRSLSTNTMISLVDASNGQIYKQSTPFTMDRNASNDFSSAIYPIQGTNNDKYLFISRGTTTGDSRRFFQFSLSNALASSTWQVERLNFAPTSYDLIIMSAAAIEFQGHTYFFMLSKSSATDIKSVYVYKDFDINSAKSCDITSNGGSSISLSTIVKDLKVVINGSKFYVYGILNMDRGNNSYVFCCSINTDLNANMVREYSTQCQAANIDYDIVSGYYDSTVDKFITYASYANDDIPATIVFDLNDPNNSDMTPTGGQVQFYKFRNGGPIQRQRASLFMPILTSYGNFDESNIIVTKSGWTSYIMLDISKYPAGDTNTYHYAYQTRPKSDVIEIEGASDVNLLGKDSTTLNRAYQDQLTSNFVQHVWDDSNFKGWIKGDYAGNEGAPNYNSPQYYQSIYKGEAPVSLYATGTVFTDSGGMTTINSGDESYYFDNITLTGFYKWFTEFKVDNLNLFDNIANDQTAIEAYVKQNYNDIFKDLPVDFTVDNIVSVSIDTTYPSNIICTITLNNWIDENGVLHNTDQDFTIIANNNTHTKNDLINGTIPMDFECPYYPEWFINATNENYSIYYDKLKTFIANNFFDNVPDGGVNVLDIEFGAFDNINGTLEIKNVIVSNYIENTFICSGSGFFKKLPVNTTITGFHTITPTIIDSNITIPSTPAYNVIDITNDQIIDIIKNNLVLTTNTNVPVDFTTNNIFVDETTIVRDAQNSTITVNVGINNYFDERGNIASFAMLTQTITIHGFTPVSLDTAINEENGGVYDIPANSPLANLNVNSITGDEADLLQFLIDSNIFINLPSQFGIDNITDVLIESREGSIVINSITINKYVNEQGQVINENKTFSDINIVLRGFNGATPTIGESTYLKTAISGQSTVSTTSLASEVSDVDAKEALISLLNNNKTAFANLASSITTFNSDNVIFVNKVADDNAGILSVEFTFSLLMINGQEISVSQDSVANLTDDYIFSANLTGFKSLKWQNLDTTVNFNNQNIYDLVNNNQLTLGFDYVQAIQNKLINYLDENTSTLGYSNDTINAIKSYINGDFANPSNFKINYNYADLNNSTIVVTSSQLDNLSGTTMWSSGVVFNISNAQYQKTTASLKTSFDPTVNSSVSLSEFKTNILPTININDVADFTNLSTSNFTSESDFTNPDKIAISVVNEKSNKAQLAITFNTYYGNGGILNNYTLVFDHEFTFATESNNENTLNETVSANLLGVVTCNSYQLVALLNQADVNEVNTWLNNHKNSLFASNDNLQDVTLSFNTSTIDNLNSNQVVITLSFNNQYHRIKVTGLTPIVATNITTNISLPNDVNANNIMTYFNTDPNNKSKSFISWDDTSMLPTLNQATVIEAKAFNLTYKDDGNYQVYINFVFNGVYLSNASQIQYASNYTYQVLVDNLPPDASTINNASIIATNNTDKYIDVNNIHKEINASNEQEILPIILAITLSLSTILLSILIYLFYRYKKQRKVMD